MISLCEEIRQIWTREDYKYLEYLKKKLVEFSHLYLRHFDKPLYREVNRMVIEDIKKEMEGLNAGLCGDKANRRDIRYHLAGNTAETG
jgi:hypothetical protein